MEPFIAAQGDVLLVAIHEVPQQARPVPVEAGRVVLAHGEATGHHHSFAHRPEIALFRDDGAGGRTYLRVNGAPAALEHQEHTTIAVPPGCYEVRRQRTFHAGMAQRVAD